MAAAVAVAALFGAIIGSFLTVVAHRVPRGESIVSPGSACPECGRALRWRDNVPLVSWVALRGRCPGCGTTVSWRYPAIEAATAVGFAAVVAVRGVRPELALDLPFVALLVVVAATDLEHRLVPNRILLPFAGYGLVAVAVVDWADAPERLASAAGAFLAFLAITLAYPAGMGMGDVKLAGVMGLYLGLSVLPALLVAFLTGSIVGVSMIARGGVEERKRAVPFVPFLALGGFVGLVAGPELIDLYAAQL